MNATSAASSSERIASFEGLRGYAVGLVFLVHFVDHYVTRRSQIDLNRFGVAQATTVDQWLAWWAWASHYGVDLFFFLSGFLICRLVARPEFHFGRFVWHRLHRLYPAFAVALLLHVAYQGHFWNVWRDWRTLALNAVFAQGFFELGIPAVIMQSWSLSFEWLFYLTTPLVLMLVRRGGEPLRAWHVGLAGALTLAALVPIGSHYARFVMFFAGGLLATAPAAAARAWLARAPEVVVVAAYLAVTTWFMFDHDYAHFAWPYAIVCLLLVAKAAYGNGGLARLFCLRPMRALGNVSYSFYLLHSLAVVIVIDHLGPVVQALPGAVQCALLLMLSFVLAVVVSRLSYRWLEQPYFLRRQRATVAPTLQAIPAQ